MAYILLVIYTMNDTQTNPLHGNVRIVRAAIALGISLLLSAFLSNTAYAKIYTCVDAQGRKLTSDRPIAACLDREQKQMTASGVVKRIVQPSYTKAELKEKERLQKQAEAKAAQERARANTLEALLQRYPTPASLKKERLEEAELIEVRIRDGYTRLKEIQARRTTLNKELAFYTKNPEKTPRPLKIQKKSLEDGIKKSHDYIAVQRKELVELHKKFDAEREILLPLWQQ